MAGYFRHSWKNRLSILLLGATALLCLSTVEAWGQDGSREWSDWHYDPSSGNVGWRYDWSTSGNTGNYVVQIRNFNANTVNIQYCFVSEGRSQRRRDSSYQEIAPACNPGQAATMGSGQIKELSFSLPLLDCTNYAISCNFLDGTVRIGTQTSAPAPASVYQRAPVYVPPPPTKEELERQRRQAENDLLNSKINDEMRKTDEQEQNALLNKTIQDEINNC